MEKHVTLGFNSAAWYKRLKMGCVAANSPLEESRWWWWWCGEMTLGQMAEQKRWTGQRLWYWQRVSLNCCWTWLVSPPQGKIGLICSLLKHVQGSLIFDSLRPNFWSWQNTIIVLVQWWFRKGGQGDIFLPFSLSSLSSALSSCSWDSATYTHIHTKKSIYLTILLLNYLHGTHTLHPSEVTQRVTGPNFWYTLLAEDPIPITVASPGHSSHFARIWQFWHWSNIQTL